MNEIIRVAKSLTGFAIRSVIFTILAGGAFGLLMEYQHGSGSAAYTPSWEIAAAQHEFWLAVFFGIGLSACWTFGIPALVKMKREGVGPLAAIKAVRSNNVVGARFEGDDHAEGTRDYQTLASRGHVKVHQIQAVAPIFVVPATVLFFGALVAAYIAVSTTAGGGIRIPASWRAAMSYDPAHYAVLPGYAQKGDYRLAWLAAAAGEPTRGLTEKGYHDLVDAAARDIQAHGDQSDTWEFVLKAAPDAVITRPEKVFAGNLKDLGVGVVALVRNTAVPAQSGTSPVVADHTVPVASVAAWVDAKLRIMVIDFAHRSMSSAVGDGDKGVPLAPPSAIDALRPVAAAKL
jgi:hypothetical protein